jgi:hypothetical protein
MDSGPRLRRDRNDRLRGPSLAFSRSLRTRSLGAGAARIMKGSAGDPSARPDGTERSSKKGWPPDGTSGPPARGAEASSLERPGQLTSSPGGPNRTPAPAIWPDGRFQPWPPGVRLARPFPLNRLNPGFRLSAIRLSHARPTHRRCRGAEQAVPSPIDHDASRARPSGTGWFDHTPERQPMSSIISVKRLLSAPSIRPCGHGRDKPGHPAITRKRFRAVSCRRARRGWPAQGRP